MGALLSANPSQPAVVNHLQMYGFLRRLCIALCRFAYRKTCKLTTDGKNTAITLRKLFLKVSFEGLHKSSTVVGFQGTISNNDSSNSNETMLSVTIICSDGSTYLQGV